MTTNGHFRPKPGVSHGYGEAEEISEVMKAALEISANKGKFWQVALQLITSF